MKEPELKPAEEEVSEETSIPGREPVPGGKALARLLDFQVRRGVEAAGVEEAAPKVALTAPETLCAEPHGPGAGGPPTLMAAPALTGEPRSLYLSAFRALSAAGARAGGRVMAVAEPVPSGWQQLGPFSIPHGQTYGSGPGSRPPVAGRVSAVAIDPGDDRHLLIAAAGGGIWESQDQGETWQPRTDDQPSLSVGALAFDPSDRSIVYAGTGEGDTFSWLGVGLLRSTDGGTTWDLHAESPFQGVSFFDLWVDPLDGQRLFAATTAGLFESTDGGETWASRRSALTWSVSIQPADPNDATAEREVLAGCRDGVFRSSIGETTWQSVTLPSLPAAPDRLEVCHAPSAREVRYVVGAGPPAVPDPLANRPMPHPYLWRSDTAAGGFALFTPPPTLQTGQAYYDWFAAVAPDDENVLYVGGINVHRGERSAAGVWSWSNISARASGTSIHPDQHALAFSPADPSTLYIGNDGGVYASADGGATWRSLNKGLSITEFEFLAQHARFDAWLIGGTQDNGTLRYEGQGVWHHVQDGDGGDCGASESSPYTCFHTFYGMGMERSTEGGGWGTWDWVGPNVPESENYRKRGALFYPPVEVRDTVVAQAGKSVWISTESGAPSSWSKRNLPPTAGRASALAIPQTDRIYVGTERGHVYLVERVSGTWRAAKALAFPTHRFISDLLVDPTDPDRLWATCSDLFQPGVFRSDDHGESWIDVSAGLPTIPINAIEVDPTSPDTVFVAADVGVYRSFDAGRTWAPFSEGLPNALVKDLLFHAPSRLLRAATQSRGVWEIAVDQVTMPDVQVFLRDSVVDTGRRVPSPSGVDDPFQPGLSANWWTCPDIKVDSSPFHAAAIDEVDFEVFGDDRDLIDDGHQFATGLRQEAPVRGQAARVYVQVHNRGAATAFDVAVKVFFQDVVDHLPLLEDGFWDGFPANAPSSGTPWQPVADHEVIAQIEPGRSAVVGFEWQVPGGSAPFLGLLAAVSAGNDELVTTESRVSVLVPGNTKCGLKIFAM